MSKHRIAATLFLVLAGLSPVAFPAQYVVCPEGHGEGEALEQKAPFGTAENPWGSVDDALGVLRAGDTLVLCGGTYVAGFELKALVGAAERPIVITAKAGERVLFDLADADAGIRLTDCAHVVLRGLEVAGVPSGSGIALSQCRHCVVEGNVFHDSQGVGIWLTASNDCIVRGNVCYYNDSGAYVGDGSTGNLIEANVLAFGNRSSENADGVGSSNCEENTYRYNLLVANNDDGLDMWTSTGSLIEYNLATLNGDQKEGDGNGFKLGGRWKTQRPERDIWLGGGHTVRRNVSFDNLSTGFTDNGSMGNRYEDNVAYGNRNTGAYASVTHTDPAAAAPILARLRERYLEVFDAGLIRPEVNPLPDDFDKVRALGLWPVPKE